jgi:radical SAM protein with 4Fe4S-binding SPASM domain
LDCIQTACLSDQEYWLWLREKVAEQRIPVAGGLALTHRCNQRCVHCYAGPLEAHDAKRKEELTTAQVIDILDDVTRAGCLSLFITGGEPLLRRDFAEIYQHAKESGLFVTVLTNGTLISERIAALFQDLPPWSVEITLYGATAATYERITRTEGSFDRCVAGIKRLLEIGVRVALKTVLMTLNRDELSAMRELAEGYDVSFRFDPAIFPRLDGDRSVLRLRVSPEEVIEKEFSDPARAHELRQFRARLGDPIASDRLYVCGAGRTSFHIDPYGNLQPCLMTVGEKYNLLQGSFEDGWKESAANKCNVCPARTLCTSCPAFSAMENGDEDVHSAYLCAMGKLRWEAVNNAV